MGNVGDYCSQPARGAGKRQAEARRYVTLPAGGSVRQGGDHGAVGGAEPGRAPVSEPEYG